MHINAQIEFLDLEGVEGQLEGHEEQAEDVEDEDHFFDVELAVEGANDLLQHRRLLSQLNLHPFQLKQESEKHHCDDAVHVVRKHLPKVVLEVLLHFLVR